MNIMPLDISALCSFFNLCDKINNITVVRTCEVGGSLTTLSMASEVLYFESCFRSMILLLIQSFMKI